MEILRGSYKDGVLITTEGKTINQYNLTPDCWLIQFSGLKACEDCDLRNTSECGGGETLKRMKLNQLNEEKRK